jgi:hypothetical protein
MEVHHPHHPTHKKKWSEYIIEFVMLFTAVTLGFFAENIREGIAEKHKKKELLAAVVKDFKTDKEEFNRHRVLIKQRIEICDNYTKFLQMDYRNVNKIDFYLAAITYGENKDVVFNEKSRNDAEAKGYFTDETSSDLSTIMNKYNYHLNDYKLVNTAVLEKCKSYFNSTIYEVLDPNLILKTDFLFINKSQPVDARFNGNLDHPVDKKVADKIIFDAWLKKVLLVTELRSFDSLDLYANKAIEQLQEHGEGH